MVFVATTYLKDCVLDEVTVEVNEDNLSMADMLELALRHICKKLDISHPLWLAKNTKEWSLYYKTQFFALQFEENIKFDKLYLEVK